MAETLPKGSGMEKIHEIALACIGRAVMFGVLAIACVMVGFSFNPVSSLRSGALLTLMMAAVLLWKAWSAGHKDPKTTEVWLYLDENNRPTDQYARLAFAIVMRDVYGMFARLSLIAACTLFAISLVLTLLGFEPFTPDNMRP